MTDDQLIAEVARVWVDGGGDAEGLDWCRQKLKEAVNAEIENRVMQEQAREQGARNGNCYAGDGDGCRLPGNGRREDSTVVPNDQAETSERSEV
jgi:hypothetical protein